MNNAPILSIAQSLARAFLYAPMPQTAKHVMKFFAAQTNNDNTRWAYLNATKRSAEWRDKHGLRDLVH